jgi:hypothetical protein
MTSLADIGKQWRAARKYAEEWPQTRKARRYVKVSEYRKKGDGRKSN